MKTSVSRFGTLVREAVVVFAGVAIALAADDWRETRSDVEELERSFVIVREDLRRDSLEISLTRDGAAAHAAAALWFFDEWDKAAADRDRLDETLLVFDSAPRPRFSRAGYEGLLSQNRLRLMQDEDLRQALFQYYQVDQPQSAAYWDVLWERREGVLGRLAPHILFLTNGGAEARVTLRGSWSALTADAVLHAELRRYGGSMVFEVDRLETLQADVNGLLAAFAAR